MKDIRKAAKTVKYSDVEAALKKARNWLQSRASRLAPRKLVNLMRLSTELIQDYIHGRYRDVPFGTISALTVTVVYIVNPFDIVPDILPGIGWVDDLIVATACVSLIRIDLLRYCEWRGLNPSAYGLDDGNSTPSPPSQPSGETGSPENKGTPQLKSTLEETGGDQA